MNANTQSFSFINATGTHPNFAALGKLALALAVPPALWLARQPLAAMLDLLKDRDALIGLVQGLGAWGPLMLGLTIALQVTFAVLPGHVLMLAGGYLYGFVPGFLITWVSTVAASQVNFMLARRYGRPLVYKMAPRRLVDRWEAAAQDKGFVFFLMTLVLPIFPSDLMCYVAGFSKISHRGFWAANLLGHLPCAVGMSLVGSGLLVVAPGGWLWAIGLCIVALVVWRRYGQAVEQRFFPYDQQGG
jgi:uncharacterized membrane protein YdjX (TVP38/TMEM64 family)